MALNPTPSLLDHQQILQRVFDKDNDALRTDTDITIGTITGDVTVDIDATTGDNIALANADGSKKVTVTTVGPDNGLDVNIIGGAVDATVSGTVDTNLLGLPNFQTSQYSIGTSAVQITLTPLTNRSSISIKAVTTTNNMIYIGNSSSVTTSTGYPLFNGDSLQFDLTGASQIWLIASASSQTACILEIG